MDFKIISWGGLQAAGLARRGKPPRLLAQRGHEEPEGCLDHLLSCRLPDTKSQTLKPQLCLPRGEGLAWPIHPRNQGLGEASHLPLLQLPHPQFISAVVIKVLTEGLSHSGCLFNKSIS